MSWNQRAVYPGDPIEIFFENKTILIQKKKKISSAKKKTYCKHIVSFKIYENSH